MKNTHAPFLGKFATQAFLQKGVALVLAIAVIGSVGYVGSHHSRGSHAASGAVLSVSPASGSFVQGSNVAVTIHEDSGTDPVNTVQLSMPYNPNLLQYVSMSEGTAFPQRAATDTATPGTIRVGRSVNAGAIPATGNNTVVTVNFKVLGSSGVATVNFDKAYSFVVRSTDSTDILSVVTGGTYNLSLPAPTITSVSPTQSPTQGGTAVTLTGTNFVSGATVLFGTTPAKSVTFNSATSLTVVSPAHIAGLANVFITNPDGQQAQSLFSYAASSPTISGVSPASGPTTGGTRVTIIGTNFLSGATVRFDNTVMSGIDVTYNSATSITVTAPDHAAGAVAVTVLNPDQQVATKASAFTYVAPAPSISGVAPTSGTNLGGTSVTISGTNFVSGATVKFGGSAATNVAVTSSTSLRAVSPAHVAGLVDVSVTNPDGQSAAKASAYTYRLSAPAVSAVSPGFGWTTGGVVITLTGSNFVSGATVSVGGSAATSVAVINATSLRATTPVYSNGPVDVTVTNPDGQAATQAQSFTYVLSGDATHDGRINALDLSLVLSHDGQNYPPADFNNDGTIGAADLAMLLGHWTW